MQVGANPAIPMCEIADEEMMAHLNKKISPLTMTPITKGLKFGYMGMRIGA